MNKQDEEKAKANSIATNNLDRCFGNKQMYGATCALEMAAWKEQQMIEKAVDWINIHMLYNASESYKKEIIENFKKTMEEN